MACSWACLFGKRSAWVLESRIFDHEQTSLFKPMSPRHLVHPNQCLENVCRNIIIRCFRCTQVLLFFYIKTEALKRDVAFSLLNRKSSAVAAILLHLLGLLYCLSVSYSLSFINVATLRKCNNHFLKSR